jgi:hypothetical protein
MSRGLVLCALAIVALLAPATAAPAAFSSQGRATTAAATEEAKYGEPIAGENFEVTVWAPEADDLGYGCTGCYASQVTIKALQNVDVYDLSFQYEDPTGRVYSMTLDVEAYELLKGQRVEGSLIIMDEEEFAEGGRVLVRVLSESEPAAIWS